MVERIELEGGYMYIMFLFYFIYLFFHFLAHVLVFPGQPLILNSYSDNCLTLINSFYFLSCSPADSQHSIYFSLFCPKFHM